MVDMELCVITCGTMRMQLLCVFSKVSLLMVSHFLFTLPLFLSILSPSHNLCAKLTHSTEVLSFKVSLKPAGAIAIDGGLFNDPWVPVLIGNVECSGNENNLLECSHATESDEVVSQCDPRENAAVTCQSKCIL